MVTADSGDPVKMGGKPNVLYVRDDRVASALELILVALMVIAIALFTLSAVVALAVYHFWGT